MSNSISISVAQRWLATAFIAGLVGCGADDPSLSEPANGSPGAQADAEVPESPAPNQAPRIDSVRFDPERPIVGEAVRAVTTVVDPDGDSVWIDHEWQVAGVPVEAGTPRILLRGARKGDLVKVTVTARDGKDESESWTESVAIANSPPRVGRVRVQPGNEIVAGTPIVVRPEAIDPDGDPVTYRYAWKVRGVAVSESGPQLQTDQLRRGDRVEVTVYASDPDDESEPVEVPALTIVNTPPQILAGSGRPIAGDGSFHRVRAEDPDGDPQLLFELENPPDGMTIDAVSGAISWKPSAVVPGTHHVAVIVDDLNGGRTRQVIEVTVGLSGSDAQPPASQR